MLFTINLFAQVTLKPTFSNPKSSPPAPAKKDTILIFYRVLLSVLRYSAFSSATCKSCFVQFVS